METLEPCAIVRFLLIRVPDNQKLVTSMKITASAITPVAAQPINR